nr:type II toxin-antitoxin system HicB family antitoxin [uncultured Rhodopila sp.]
MSEIEYRFTIRPLTPDEGGYLIEFPDLPGCMADGETIEEALINGQDAKADWIAAMQEAGRPVPPPTAQDSEAYSGKWVLRTRKSLRRGLAERARQEGVSLNALAVAMLAQCLGQRMPRDG